ncbi:MAG: damage-control phosphatase ARMT1 family protein [bacterium]
MKAQPYCYDCLASLVHRAAMLATPDEAVRRKAVAAGLEALRAAFSPDRLTLVMAMEVHQVIRQVTGNPDPYLPVKQREMSITHQLQDEVRLGYADNFQGRLKVAAAANAMDFFRDLNLLRDDLTRQVEFFIDQSVVLQQSAKRATRILYLADNAGELHLDLPLLEWFRRCAEVPYVVKPAPIQNDATIEDVNRSGYADRFAPVITTGLACPGVVFEQASDDFRREFERADLVFAKGMGHWEGLSELQPEGKVFHCLMAKCQPVADSLGVPLNAYVACLR